MMANIWEKAISILAGNLNFFGFYGISKVDFRSSFIFWLRTRRKKHSLIYVVEKSTTYYLPIWPQIGTHPGGCLCYLACAGAGKNLLKNHLVWFKMDKQQEEEKIKKDKQSDIRPKIFCTCCKKLGANFLKCCKPERYVHTEEKTSAEFFKVSY